MQQTTPMCQFLMDNEEIVMRKRIDFTAFCGTVGYYDLKNFKGRSKNIADSRPVRAAS